MSKDRVIHLLNDEEIGMCLSGLTLLKRQYSKDELSDEVISFLDNLYNKIDKCEDMGVINDERIW